MLLLKFACEEEGDGKVDDSTHVWGAIGLGPYAQDDTALRTQEVDVLGELVLEYVGSCAQWVVRYIVVLDEIPRFGMSFLLLLVRSPREDRVSGSRCPV